MEATKVGLQSDADYYEVFQTYLAALRRKGPPEAVLEGFDLCLNFLDQYLAKSECKQKLLLAKAKLLVKTDLAATEEVFKQLEHQFATTGSWWLVMNNLLEGTLVSDLQVTLSPRSFGPTSRRPPTQRTLGLTPSSGLGLTSNRKMAALQISLLPGAQRPPNSKLTHSFRHKTPKALSREPCPQTNQPSAAKLAKRPKKSSRGSETRTRERAA